jgi:phosphate transport system substrate-binding protein
VRRDTGGMTKRVFLTMLGCVAVLSLVAAGCGGDDDSSGGGLITADGSSTVGPFTTKAAEDWKAAGGGDVTVGISGTGGGFERFCADETDISNASRSIDEDEVALCEEAGVDFIELRVATDALTNVVNLENDWATCLTVDQLNAIWEPGSTVNNWSQVDPSFPDVPLKLYGAGTDSGTFDYFTDAINGEEGASRTDFSATEDDNVTVQGVSGDRGALGYFGLSYFEENADVLKAVEVDGGGGCVAPSAETAQADTYTPLSRPLFMYVKVSSLEDNESVGEFLRFALENQNAIAEEALYVPLSQEQIDEQLEILEGAAS